MAKATIVRGHADTALPRVVPADDWRQARGGHLPLAKVLSAALSRQRETVEPTADQGDAVPVVLRPVERLEAPVALSSVDGPKLSA